jgi:rhodanese-related sulfurtransferase
MEQILKSLTLDFFGKGKHKISPEKFFEIENGFLLDVRSKEEAGSIMIKMEYHPNMECKNIPIDEIPDRISEIPKEKSVAVFCPANVRSAIVYAYLLSKGFSDIRIVEGGYSALTEALKPGKVLKVLQKNAE